MAWQLNDLTMDLKTPADLAPILRELNNKLEAMSWARMMLGALVLNLSKLQEILEHYGKDIQTLPTEIRDDLNGIKQKIKKKEIYAYRNTYIAHAFLEEKVEDKKMKRPLSLDEATTRLRAIIDEGLAPPMENVHAFCRWVYESGDQKCVVNVIHTTVSTLEKQLGGLGRRT